MVAVSPQGKYIAAAGVNPSSGNMELLSLFESKTYTRVGKNFTFSGMGRAIAFSSDETKLATVQLPGLFGLAELLNLQKPSLTLIDLDTEKRRDFATSFRIRCLAFSPDGLLLAAGCEDQIVRLWNVSLKRWDRDCVGHSGALDQVAFSKDGKRLFSTSGIDRTIRVWNNDPDGETLGKEVQKVTLDGTIKKYLSITFDRHNRALTGSGDGRIVLWDLESGEVLYRFTHKDTAVTAVAVSPDGHHALAALGDHQVFLYRLPPPGGKR